MKMESNSKSYVKFQIFHGSVARRVLLRSFLIAAAMSVIPLVQILTGPYLKMLSPIASGGCTVHHRSMASSSSNFTPSWYVFQGRHLNPIWSSIEPTQCLEYANLTETVVGELVEKKLLNPTGARALCLGEGSDVSADALRGLGFVEALGVEEQRFFAMKRKQFVYEIDHKDESFDFVFSRDLDTVSVSVPAALVVHEIERVLKPGGIGAVLVGTAGLNPKNSLVRSATPISSVLKMSSVVHVKRVENLTLVTFEKRIENVGIFEQYKLPSDCPSVINNRPFVSQMEPIAKKEKKKNFSYLPNFADISSKKRLVYINIGAGKHLNSNPTNWFPPNYPINQKAFNVYFVDHNTSVMLSYVRKPGITFVYHPGLSGTDKIEKNPEEDSEHFLGKSEFDFLAWFKETSQYADFVVLKMNAGKSEVKFLSELFETGAICYVDEMFLHCPEKVSAIDGETSSAPADCVDLLEDLRKSGVFVHQWWGNSDPTGVW